MSYRSELIKGLLLEKGDASDNWIDPINTFLKRLEFATKGCADIQASGDSVTAAVGDDKWVASTLILQGTGPGTVGFDVDCKGSWFVCSQHTGGPVTFTADPINAGLTDVQIWPGESAWIHKTENGDFKKCGSTGGTPTTPTVDADYSALPTDCMVIVGAAATGPTTIDTPPAHRPGQPFSVRNLSSFDVTVPGYPFPIPGVTGSGSFSQIELKCVVDAAGNPSWI